MPPDEHALQVADQLGDDRFERAAALVDACPRGRLVVGLGGRAQDRRLRLQRVDLVERPQDRKHDVAVVDRIGDRLRKRLAKRFEQLLIVHESYLAQAASRRWRI